MTTPTDTPKTAEHLAEDYAETQFSANDGADWSNTYDGYLKGYRARDAEVAMLRETLRHLRDTCMEPWEEASFIDARYEADELLLHNPAADPRKQAEAPQEIRQIDSSSGESLISSSPRGSLPNTLGASDAPQQITDEEIRALLDDLDGIARHFDHYEYGLPLHDEDCQSKMIEAVRALLAAPTAGPKEPKA